MTVAAAKKKERREAIRRHSDTEEIAEELENEYQVEPGSQDEVSSVSLLILSAFIINGLSWCYLLLFAPNHYQATEIMVGTGQNIFFGFLASIFGPMLMMIEGLRVAPLMLLFNSALSVVLLLAGKYKSGLWMWILTGALSYCTMIICLDDSSVRAMSSLGALTIMFVAPAVLPIFILVICIGLSIAGINASLNLLAAFAREVERRK